MNINKTLVNHVYFLSKYDIDKILVTYISVIEYDEILGCGQATEMDMTAFEFFKFFTVRNIKKCYRYYLNIFQ